jgi:translocation and assembly module TamA
MAKPVRCRHTARPLLISCRLIAAAGMIAALSLPAATVVAATEAAANTTGYELEIEGAGDQAKLLRQHLDIARRQENGVESEDELTVLFNGAPDQIRELLATQGYFSPTIKPELNLKDSAPVARFSIDLGPPTRVASVDIRFKGDIASGPKADPRRIERLRRRWSLDPGDVFNQKDWIAAKNDLLKSLLANDFPAAGIVRSEASINREKHAATITIEVDSGPAFTFGDLQINGLERYSREMIDLLNPIRPGDAYSLDKLNELQSRLEDTGYFRTAFATVEADIAHPQNAPVRVDLVENQRKRLSLGVGFSTDTGPRLQAKWLDRNFLLRNWRLESELRFDRDTRLLASDVYLPAIMNGWQPSFGTHLERTVSAGETVDKIRIGTRLSSANKADEKVYAIAYLGDQQRIGDFRNTRQALIASFSYTQRRLDHPLTPRRGHVIGAEIGFGLKGLVNETNILRTVVRGTYLMPIIPRWNAVFRGYLGQVSGGSRLNVPGDLLFRTGGDQSVRGYGYNTLGVPQDGAIVGGTVSAVASAEVVYQFMPPWGIALFHDAGNAADSWRDFRFAQGTGVGARWRSPIGPVNVDLAFSHETRKPRLHFSVGYAF